MDKTTEAVAMLTRFLQTTDKILNTKNFSIDEMNIIYFLKNKGFISETAQHYEYILLFDGEVWLEEYEADKQKALQAEKNQKLSMLVAIVGAVLAGLSFLTAVFFGILPYLLA